MSNLIPLRALAIHAADTLRPLSVNSLGLDPDQQALVVVMADHVHRLYGEAISLQGRPAGLLGDLQLARYHLTQALHTLDQPAISRAHLTLAVDRLDVLAEGIRLVLRPSAA